MKGILIDPFTRTITERDIARDGLKDIYDSISAECFCCVALDRGDALYCDDEGLYRENQEFFAIGRYPQPIAGRALILGCDPEGNSVTPKVSLDTVRKHVRWLTPAETVAKYREAQAALHANAAIEKASERADFVIVSAPDVTIDPDTGKARAL